MVREVCNNGINLLGAAQLEALIWMLDNSLKEGKLMIDQPTALILGAGASMDFAYPSGRKLTEQVVQITKDPRSNAYRCLLELEFNETQISEFTNALRMSGRLSVDAFLEHRPEYIDIGKVAMTLSLVRFENINNLFGSADNWYIYLFNRMEAPFSSFADNKISFVTFNYDRSLEVYLFTALKNAYGKSDREVFEVISQIPIIHVHGKLGGLPWETPKGRKYESVDDPKLISSSAQGIKIISESSNIDESFGEARKVINNCERIIFLGFGYHRSNLDRLNIDLSSNHTIYGSCYGFTKRECDLVRAYFKPANIYLGLSAWKVRDYLRERVSL